MIAAHAAALGVALCVPTYAIGDAAAALFGPQRAASLAHICAPGRWSTLFANTAIVCGLAVLVAGTLGGLLALLVTRTDLPGRRGLAALALLGTCLPPYVSAVALFAVVPVSHWAGRVDVCGLVYGVLLVPLAGLLLGAALRRTPGDAEELALLDAGPPRVLWHVTRPALTGAFVTTALLVSVLVATDFSISDILLVDTFARETYYQFALDHRRAGPVLTCLPLLVALSAALTWAQRRFQLLYEEAPWHAGRAPPRYRLGRARVAVAALLGLVILLPLIAFGVGLGRHLAPPAAVLAAAAGVCRELANSALLALIAAVLVTAPALGLAHAAARGARASWPTRGAIVVLFALPAPVVGISLIGLLNRPGLLGVVYDSPAVLLLAYFVRFLPAAVLLLLPAVQAVSREIEWAARMDGCTWWQAHRHVRWPAARSPALAVALAVAVLVFGESGASILVAPPDVPLAAVRAFTLIHFGVYRDLAVLAVLAAGAILVPWLGLVWLVYRGRGATA